jgi:hypothetical protein
MKVALLHEHPTRSDTLIAALVDDGIDCSGIVQQYIESDGFVYRVEMPGDEPFYSIRQPIVADRFNCCAADGCGAGAGAKAGQPGFDFPATDGGRGIEPHQPANGVLQRVAAILKAADCDFGGVEYFIEHDSGQPCFYDLNPYSNFVAGGETLPGFSPEQRFVDHGRRQMALLQHV